MFIVNEYLKCLICIRLFFKLPPLAKSRCRVAHVNICVSCTIHNFLLLALPFAVEEGKDSKRTSRTNNFDIAELIMDLSNGTRSANLRTGSIKPKTAFLAASNFTLDLMAER